MSGEDAKANAETLEREIDHLKSGHWDMLRRQYRDFWSHAKDISAMFKTLKPLSQEDRERLWEKFSAVCEETRRTSDREHAARKNDSNGKRELVESKIREGYNKARNARTAAELSDAKSVLNTALEWMKNGWGGFNIQTQIVSSMFSEGRMLKEDSDACWAKWKEANEGIRLRREELWESAFHHFHTKASDAVNTAHHGDPKDAKNKVRDIQGELKGAQMDKSQFQEIRRMLDDAWQKASSRLQEAYQAGQRKHEEWLDRMQRNVQNWSDLIQKNESVISKIETEIDRCHEMESNAKSSDFADTVRGWIEEKYQKINDIREFNRELEERIRSVKSKIGG